MLERRKVNESVNGGWRGCDQISLISHGSWADPDLFTVIDGMNCYFNYWDIENALWEDFLEETGHKDSESEDPAVEKEFNEYCQKWAYYYMIDCFNNGYFGNPYEKGEYSNGEFCSWRPSDFVEEDVDDYEEDDDLEEGCSSKKKSSNTRKKKLPESRGWKYKLKNGKALRDAVDSDDFDEILTQLANCWREINQYMPDAYGEDDLEKDLDEIENQRDSLENYDDYDMSYEDVEEEINYLLNDFYEFCDNTRIWVELD